MDTATEKDTARRVNSGRLSFYHPCAKGTGAAVQLEPRVGLGAGRRYNCFFLDMARQEPTAENGNGANGHAKFDWEHKITVKLGFTDICEFLGVLEGLTDHAGGRRDGLYHESGEANTWIRFKRRENGGYELGLSRKTRGSETPARVVTVLSDIEALGLRHILQLGLFFITMPGLPAAWQGQDAAGQRDAC